MMVGGAMVGEGARREGFMYGFSYLGGAVTVENVVMVGQVRGCRWEGQDWRESSEVVLFGERFTLTFILSVGRAARAASGQPCSSECLDREVGSI